MSICDSPTGNAQGSFLTWSNSTACKETINVESFSACIAPLFKSIAGSGITWFNQVLRAPSWGDYLSWCRGMTSGLARWLMWAYLGCQFNNAIAIQEHRSAWEKDNCCCPLTMPTFTKRWSWNAFMEPCHWFVRGANKVNRNCSKEEVLHQRGGSFGGTNHIELIPMNSVYT